MKPLNKLRRTVGCIVLFIPICFCGICILSWWSFPPTDFLARLYLSRVVAGDYKGASSMAYFHRPEDLCDQDIEEDAIKDITKFGGAEIRNLAITIYNGTGSDDNWQSATVNFEYRKPNQAQWSNGKMRLESDANYWGIRFICDNMMYSHPYP